MKVACVVLAAGASTRLGQPKQLVRLGGETLLDRAVRVAREAGCAAVVVVLGAGADAVRAGCVLDTAMIAVNPDWREGMGGSIRAGVEAVADGVDAIVVMTCDQPVVDAAHLRRLVERCGETHALRVVGSEYSGRNGVPACFPAAMFSDLRALRGDQGARALLREALSIPLPGGELDVDTPEGLARWEDLGSRETAVGDSGRLNG